MKQVYREALVLFVKGACLYEHKKEFTRKLLYRVCLTPYDNESIKNNDYVQCAYEQLAKGN